jgi:hypothetical protein
MGKDSTLAEASEPHLQEELPPPSLAGLNLPLTCICQQQDLNQALEFTKKDLKQHALVLVIRKVSPI